MANWYNVQVVERERNGCVEEHFRSAQMRRDDSLEGKMRDTSQFQVRLQLAVELYVCGNIDIIHTHRSKDPGKAL